MTDSVVKFPSGPMEQTVKRQFESYFVRGRELGLTNEQVMEMIVQTAKEVGATVTVAPPDNSPSAL